MYEAINTDYDVMKEFLIQGASLENRYGIPELPAVNCIPDETVDFEISFSPKIKNHRKLNVNFYIQDYKFLRVWNNPDKYLDHLSCFHSVISPDFSIATGTGGMPFAMNLYNKYRNHALSWYFHLKGIKVIPSVSILEEADQDWAFAGIPKFSVLSVCTNGRIKALESRIAFCRGFYAMCDYCEPLKIIVVGRLPRELKSPIEIINLESRSQKINRYIMRLK